VTRIAFLGTPRAAVPSLEAVAPEVSVVVTRQDKPRGRSRSPLPPPVKTTALGLGLDVRQPVGRSELATVLEEAQVDVAIVVAYGRIIPERILSSVPHGFLNVHFSLLPRWRGAAPVERCILAGDEETGVTIMKLDAGLDTGPTLASMRVWMGPRMDADALSERLALEGAALLSATLPAYLSGDLEPVPQPVEGATYAHRFDREEARLDLSQGAEMIDRVIRASTTRGGAFVLLDGAPFKIWRAVPAEGSMRPGEITVTRQGVLVGTGEGTLRLLEVQPSGRRRMDAAAWARGHRVAAFD
jgi:methionyl-tRNA formyltransferase